MILQVEISNFDLRFEDHRLRSPATERILLASIAQNGIRDPLQGVDMEDSRILLNGFKRYRCAKKLGIGIVPYVSLSSDTGAGIIELLRMSNEKGLSILEQARLITELKQGHHMSTADIARLLEKSKAWVSVRSGITSEMSPVVMEKIFCGQFPAYAYLYILRPFIRLNRMKCFFHEALMFWKYSAPVCIIDNTSLARLRGTGKNAVIAPEMEQFAKSYGFCFVCHEKGHANRKAGDERGFYTSTTNFFPGRQFMDLQDLNRQALDWATVRWLNRPVGKSKLIPAKAFEFEQAYLTRLPAVISPPYLEFDRGIDQYGYIAFDGNFYWTPGTGRHQVKVLRYPDHIKIYHRRELLIEYALAPVEVKNQKFYPPDRPKPKHEPRDRKNRTGEEENILRSMSETIDAYLNFALDKQPGGQKHRFVRNLFRLSRRLSPELFEKAVNRALSYRVTDPDTIYRIAVLQIKEANYELPLVPIDEDFVNRPSYLQGRFTDDADLTRYSSPQEDENGSATFEDA